jgi:hypothetical protein
MMSRELRISRVNLKMLIALRQRKEKAECCELVKKGEVRWLR